ncbi:MAG TPA: hypothetical protein VJM69_04130, partial [Dehalococcoidia bacterium]|nr:hypothetical protein [Dehalococcoidia bacterium]
SLAQEANRYLDYKAPWSAIRQDRQAAARSLYTALGAISAVKSCLYPYLPFSSGELHRALGLPGTAEGSGWRLLLPEPGQPLGEPRPLFRKLEPTVAEEEEARLGQAFPSNPSGPAALPT